MRKKTLIILCLFTMILSFVIAPIPMYSDEIRAVPPPVAGIESGELYYIKNVNSGLYLNVHNSGTASGTNVNQYSYTGKENQLWKVVYNGMYGTYRLYPVHNLNMALAVNSDYYSNGANINILNETESSQSYLDWHLISNGDGSYRVLSSCSSYQKAMVVINASTTSGSNVIQWDNNGSTNGFWKFEKVERHWDGYYSNIVPYHARYVVESSAITSFLPSTIYSIDVASRWNDSENVNISTNTSYPVFVIVRGSTSLDSLGKCLRYKKVGETYIEADVNDNFDYCVIMINTSTSGRNSFNGRSTADKQMNFLHEMGHALKLSHPTQGNHPLSTGLQGLPVLSIMNQGLPSSNSSIPSNAYPSEFDKMNLYDKWISS